MYNKEKIDNIKKIISIFTKHLEKDEYAIFGSAPIYIRDIKELKDIDVIVNEKGWKKLTQKFESKDTKSGFGNVIIMDNNGIEIEIFNMWGPGKWNIDELIESSDKFEGINFVTLENVLKWKKEMDREKDQEDIRKIEINKERKWNTKMNEKFVESNI